MGDKLPYLNSKTIGDVVEILNDRLFGRFICHVWYDGMSQSMVSFNGKVIKQARKRDTSLYPIAYWREKESYDKDAGDFHVNKFQLAADAVLGDLVFI